jgi:4-carboxymuconolactone decarboxylase
VRVCWLWRSEFEWSQHSMMALRAGVLSEDELRRLEGDIDEGWGAKEHALLIAIDQLRATNKLDDEAWRELQRHFDPQQCIDVLFLVGGYVLVGMYVNAFGVPLKDGMKAFAAK